MILILGRFQPFHNGHLKVIQDAHKEDRHITIVLGSSQEKDTNRNPFSADERRQMITRTLNPINIEVAFIEVPDIQCDNSYIKHVEKHLKSKPDRIITENQKTYNLFTEAGYNVQLTERYFGISASDIRRRISTGQEWKDRVPPQVTEYLKEIDGIERIKRSSG
ncbi:nicotinamide-nucleotide adenylyltransferase [Nanoarchaeota archaeon]